MSQGPATVGDAMKLVVTGASGRMGRALIQAIAETDGVALSGALERPGADELGQDAGVLAGLGELGVTVTDDPLPAFAEAQGILDFTTAEASVGFAGLAAQARIVHIIGTTGFEDAHLQALNAAARHATIVKSGNMSLGINVLASVARKVAEVLDPSFDIEIVEMHHRAKVDAPSGTALLLGDAVAEGRGLDLAAHAIRARDGMTGPRPVGDIGFATLRGGSVVGDHTVVFAGPGERIELTHRAGDRSLFARGAVKAALWAKDRKPGLFSMDDVLGLNG